MSPGVVTLTVQASHFHPDIITFRWFCHGGELSPVASQAGSAPRLDALGFFSAWSCCRLPRGELESGVTKVWVSIHHTALKQPVTRETRGEEGGGEGVDLRGGERQRVRRGLLWIICYYSGILFKQTEMLLSPDRVHQEAQSVRDR